jgi:hypothetical protein
VQREVAKLTDAGVMVREVSGRQAYYRINDNCPFISGLKSIFSVTTVQQGIQPSQSEAFVKQG